MICYSVRINPLGFREDVVLYFQAMPTREQAILVLAALIEEGEHPAGRSSLSRCIEAVEQRGLPRIDEGKALGRLKWQVPYDPQGRIGSIVLAQFHLHENIEPDPQQEDHLGVDEPDAEIPAEEIANFPRLENSAAVAAWEDAVKQRCRVIVDNVACGNPHSKKLAAGMLARLIMEAAACQRPD